MTTNVDFKCLFLLVFLVLNASCNRDKKQEVVEGKNLNATKTLSNAKFEDDQLNQVYTAYLDLKAGLVNSDHQSVQRAAKNLESGLVDNENNKQLKATAKLISLTKDIKKQRDFFVSVTDEVYRLVSTSTLISGQVYKQYCPMAFEGKGGYWLSDSEEIRNPYFGNAMLTCGSVKETIGKD